MRDDFSTDGNLVGSIPDVGGVWAAHAATGSGPVVVSQGAITVSSAAAEDVNSAFTAVSNGSVYAGMDINYPTPSSTTAGIVTYFTHFMPGAGTTSICRVTPTGHTSTIYKLAISAGGTEVTTVTAETLAYGTTYRLVYSYMIATNKCSLWVNPTSENSTSILSSGVATSISIDRIAFRQASPTPPWTLSIRNLYVAKTFCDAARTTCPPPNPPPPPIPSPPPPTLSTIYSIQYMAIPNCDLPTQEQPLFGQIVMVEGYVTAVNRNHGFFLQNSTCCSSCPCSPWSGIYVYYDFSLRTTPSLWLPNAAVGAQ